MKVINRVGERFGRLIVIKKVETKVYPSGQKKAMYECLCDCGNTKIALSSNLVTNQTKSCGCLWKEGNAKTHGLTGTQFHHIWCGIKRRVGRGKYYKHVGMDSKWEKIEGFMDDMYDSYIKHLKKHGELNTSIDRINNSKGYFKDNCRWATKKQQSLNRNLNYTFSLANKKEDVGVYYFKWGSRTKRWVARIQLKEKQIILGYFMTKDEAIKARQEAEIKYNKIYA